MAVEMAVVNHPSGGVPPGKRRLIPSGSNGRLVRGYDAMNLCDLDDVHLDLHFPQGYRARGFSHTETPHRRPVSPIGTASRAELVSWNREVRV